MSSINSKKEKISSDKRNSDKPSSKVISKTKGKAMRGFEFKKIVEFFLKSPTTEEQTPIVDKTHTVTKNGAIPMDKTLSSSDVFCPTDCKAFRDESIESRKAEEPEKMSLLRKFCFFLSLNGGVMYIVVMAWLLPCRLTPCLMSEETWNSNFTNIQLTSNIEVNLPNSPSLMIFGYSENTTNKMSAYKISDGKLAWTTTISTTPKRIFCHSNKIGIVEKYYCFLTLDNSLQAFDVENGNMIWERNVTSDQTLSKMSVTQEIGSRSYLIAISNDYLHLFDAANGTEISIIQLPCTWTVDVKITGPWMTQKGFLWSIVCEYDDGLEVFSFNERDLLNLPKSEDKVTRRISFKPLFNQQSYSRSIDLAGDVTATPHSLVLSWADMVSMVTVQAAPSHHHHKTWERHFSNFNEYSVDITSMTYGHFKDLMAMQIAVAVTSNLNSVIHILETKNGSSVAEVEFESRSIVSMRKIPGNKGEMDMILIESVQKGNSSNETSRSDSTTKTFSILEYESNKPIFRDIITLENVYDSSLSTVSEGVSNLILATTNEGITSFHRLIVKSKNPNNNWCQNEESRNTSTIMFFE